MTWKNYKKITSILLRYGTGWVGNHSQKKISELFIRCFSEQIFVHGWIHSDPHPGNLLVRRKDNNTQIVILDHGLYERYSVTSLYFHVLSSALCPPKDSDFLFSFPDKYRIWYCKLWRAIVLRHVEDIEKYGRKLGCGDQSHLFALILSFRPSTKYA